MINNFKLNEYNAMFDYFNGIMITEHVNSAIFKSAFYEEYFHPMHAKWNLDETFLSKIDSLSDKDVEELKWLISDFWSDLDVFHMSAKNFIEYGICSNIERPETYDRYFYEDYKLEMLDSSL